MRVLVVEDEAKVRKGIVRKIERLTDFCEVVGQVRSGEEAFGMIQELKPDIVVTDIKMPGMNGLLLIEKAKQMNPLIRFIIISGYDDFEFARSAIRLGVFDYLLKPVANEDLKQALVHLHSKIEKEKQKLAGFGDFQNDARKEFIEDRNKIMSRLLTDEEPVRKDEIEEHILPDGRKLDRKYYTAAVIAPARQKQKIYSDELLRFVIANITEEVLNQNEICISFYQNENAVQVYALVQHDCEVGRMERELIRCQNKISQTIDVPVSIAAGRAVLSLDDVRKSFADAQVLIRQRIVLDRQPLITWSDYEAIKNNDDAISEETRRLILRHLMFIKKDKDQLEALIANVLDRLYQKKVSYVNIRTIYLDLVILILNEIKSRNNGQYLEIYDIDVERLTDGGDTIEILRERIFRLIDNFFRLVEEEGLEGGRKIVKEMELRIREEYFRDLKLSAFAEEYYINQSYLSTLFLQETGENFSRYLTDVRTEKAKELLETTDFSTMRVAEFVGYNDRSYFTSVFQKKTGMSPAEYRKSIR